MVRTKYITTARKKAQVFRTTAAAANNTPIQSSDDDYPDSAESSEDSESTTNPVQTPRVTKFQVARRSPETLKQWVLVDMKNDLTIPEIAEHSKTSIQQVINILDEITNICGPIEPVVEFHGRYVGEVEANVYRLYHLGYKYEAIRACMGIPVSRIHSIIVNGKRSKEIFNPKYFPGHYAV